jgi:uncharacterized membrane protein YhaH (DUF805 family)
MRKNRKAFLPIVLLFVVLNGFFIAGKSLLERWGADQNVLIIGNVLLFAITLISYVVAAKGMNNKNPHAFVRSAYGSIMIKLFVCIIAALIYIATYQKNLNKPALFTLMALYLLYTFIEVSILTKSLKSANNG